MFGSTGINTYIEDSSSDIACTGTTGCHSSTIVGTNANYAIECYGYYSCAYAKNITGIGYISCRGAQSCANVRGSIRQPTTAKYIKCSGYWSCASSTIEDTGYLVGCDGEYACYSSNILGVPNVFVRGNWAGYRATISSQNLYTGSTMTVNMYGYTSGYLSTLICYDSTHTCYLNCDGNGCWNAEINTTLGSGTWIVSCDEDSNIDCPNGYISPTSAPTGGASEIVYCRDESECSYQDVYGYSVFCDGYLGCIGGSSYSIESATGKFWCLMSSFVSCFLFLSYG